VLPAGRPDPGRIHPGLVMQQLSPLASWQWYSAVDGQQYIFWTCVSLNACFVFSAVVLFLGVEAPYGRYNQAENKDKSNIIMRVLSSIDVPAKAAWVIQECPTLLWAAWCFMFANPACKASLGNCLVLLCFAAHYVNRTIIYPLRTRGSKPIPMPVMLMAFAFCFLNGYIQCFSLMRYMVIDLSTPTTVVGIAVWATGLYLNLDSDRILRNLRGTGETGYKIPYGGLFEYVSGANFCAEILEWTGFAIATGFSLAGVTFAFCTFCNIGPRAVSHHNWYLRKFENYPKQRKALIPFIF